MANRKVLLIGIAILLLLVPIGLTLFGGGGGFSDLKSKEINCDVTLGNPIGIKFVRSGDVNIEKVSCTAEEKTFCNPTFSVLGIIPSDDINLVLRSGGKSKIKSVTINEGSSKTVKIGLCVDNDVTTGSIQAVEDGEVVDTKNVNF